MARKRMEEPTIKSWEETDDVMKKLLESQLEVEKIEANMNKEIAEIKKTAEEMAKPYKDNIKKNELLLKEFVTVHKSELDGKSKKNEFWNGWLPHEYKGCASKDDRSCAGESKKVQYA